MWNVWERLSTQHLATQWDYKSYNSSAELHSFVGRKASPGALSDGKRTNGKTEENACGQMGNSNS